MQTDKEVEGCTLQLLSKRSRGKLQLWMLE